MMERIHYLLTGTQIEVIKISRSIQNPKPVFSTRTHANYVPTEEEMVIANKLMAQSPIAKAKYDEDGILVEDANQNLYFTTSDVIIYSDTDSVEADTKVTINGESMTIENAFETLGHSYTTGVKEYKLFDGDHFGAVYDPCSGTLESKEIAAIYRHKVSKSRFRITLANGKSVVTTGDHSIMVERDGKLIEVKPVDINTDTDICICIKDPHDNMHGLRGATECN